MKLFMNGKILLNVLSFKTVRSLDLNSSFNGWRLVKGPTTNGPADKTQWSLCFQVSALGEIAFEFACYWCNNSVALYARSSSDGSFSNSIPWHQINVGGEKPLYKLCYATSVKEVA